MAQGAAKAFVCATCGKTTTNKGHLCTPLAIEEARLAVCEYCGQVATDPRHVCFPKRMDLKYYCEGCGRVATSRTLLCTPKSLPQPKVKALGAKKIPVTAKGAAKSKKAGTAKKAR